MTEIRIDSQFNGPPGSGNGGYCNGLFAAALELDPGEAAEVTLLSPPPLNQPLTTRAADNGVDIFCGEVAVARARPAQLDLTHPAPPSLSAATDASKSYSGFEQHPFPGCFVCGTARTAGDGLRIYPGPVADHSMVCAPWQPFAGLADERGMIRHEFVWSALDCPSYFGAFIEQPNLPALLGRQRLQIFQQELPVDLDYIVSAWPMGSEGRKRYGGSGLFDSAGKCLALAVGTWIVLQQ